MLEIIGSGGDVWDRINAPILGTIRDCQSTDFGWTGIMPDGHAIEVRSIHPGVHANMPDGGLKVRSSDGQLYPFLKDVFEGRLLGVYLIEHRRKRTRKHPRRLIGGTRSGSSLGR